MKLNAQKLLVGLSKASRVYLTVAIALGLSTLLVANMLNSGRALTQVPGQDYMLCSDPTTAATYLTSPWTYDALASGSQSYTVSEYQALPGYGTALPPLPNYISDQGPDADAAVIFAPGADVSLGSWEVAREPKLYFFEGGDYGMLSIQATSGSLYIGGSAPGFPLPVFDNGGVAAGISAQNDSYAYGGGSAAIANTSGAYSRGATSLTLTSSSIPLVQWGQIRIDGQGYTISSISGSQSGYTIGITGGLDKDVAANAQVHYDNHAGGVTVSYLDINNDQHNTTGTIFTGTGWTVSHNKFHDGYSTPGQGVAVYGGDEGVIEYNCFSRMGNYAVNIFGHNNKFRYNEVFETNYMPDPGCGCSGGGKWWGTLNADIVDNAFIRSSPGEGLPVWLDNGNTGTLISGNFFDKSYGSAVHAETGHNLYITNNLFQDGGWGDGTGGCGTNCNGAINLNSNGGFDVPGSRYNNQVIVSNNQFINNWEGINIWQSGARSCENSGQGWPYDSSYCSGGFPITKESTAGGEYYFSHTSDANFYDTTTVDEDTSAGSTTLLVRQAMAINDYIGFVDPPPSTTTTSTTDVTTLNGSQSINAASTAAFPSSGQLRVATTTAWTNGEGSYTGAILTYTGKTANSFTGVAFVRGSGNLSGTLRQIEPYRVVSQTCYANDCLLNITPALTSPVSAGTTVTNAGTCQLYATPGATPTNPLAPNGISYWEGCQWGTRNITISGNTFVFDQDAINAGTPLNGGTNQCNAGNNCGINFQAFQSAGEPPFDGAQAANAMMSNSGLTGCPDWDPGCTTNPLANINALANPPGAPAGNGAPPNNIVWSNNAFYGAWTWQTYHFGTCGPLPTDSQTGLSMPNDACDVDFTNWQSYWMQDSDSTYSATVPPDPDPPPGSTKIGDFNNDNQVNIYDLSILLSKWQNSGGGINADLNTDNVVNIYDLSIFLSHWGD